MGSCLCGAVGFHASLPSNWVAHCHCTRCQRAHGAAFVTWVGMQAERVDVKDPGRALRWYQAPTGASRGFCGACGSPMFFISPAYPGELHIARALFTTPVDREPESNAFFSHRVLWGVGPEQLPVDPEAG